MNPPIRIIRSYYDREKFRWLLQIREVDKLGAWYRTVGKTRWTWRFNWWRKRFGIEEM